MPKPYQEKAIKFGLQNPHAGLLLDPGLGKTSITLAIIKLLLRRVMRAPVLIVAPLRVVYSVWPAEIAKWAEFSELRCSILHGRHKDARLGEPADIYLINPAGLEWLFTTAWFKRQPFGMLVIDESTAFKSPSAKRFKLLKHQLRRFPRRLILTGTFAPNGLLDVFSQVYIIDHGLTFGQYITHFRREYFEPAGDYFAGWEPKPDTEQRIYRAIKPLVLRMSADDYLALPEVVENNIYVELPDDARDVYDELEREFFAYLDTQGTRIKAVNAAVAAGKLRQIASGSVFHEVSAFDDTTRVVGGRPPPASWSAVHDAKLDALQELCGELQGAPMMIAYSFDHERERLLKVLGRNTPCIRGGQSPTASDAILREWNTGRIPYLLCQPAAMAHGLNAQTGGQHIVWYSLTWNYEHYIQFRARVRRQGSPFKNIFVHHLLARDTIDEALQRAVKNKRKTEETLLAALSTYRAERGPKPKRARR